MDTETKQKGPAPKHKKTVIALSAVTCGLLSLLSYEVLSNYSSPISEEIHRKESKPLVILDDQSEEGYAVVDLGYSIGKSAKRSTEKETVESLKYQLDDHNKQLGNLRTHLLTKGSLADHPRVADLKKQLADTQVKLQAMLEKKRLLKDELMKTKEVLEERNSQLRELAFKKKELREHIERLEVKLKGRDDANKELLKELDNYKQQASAAETAKTSSDSANAKLMARLQKMKEELLHATKSNHALERNIYQTNVEMEELRTKVARSDNALQNLIRHHLEHVRGNTDELTFSILANKAPKRSLYVNYEQSKSDVTSPESAARHFDLLAQLGEINTLSPSNNRTVKKSVANEEPVTGGRSSLSTNELLEKIQKLEDELTYTNMDNIALESTIQALQQEVSQSRSALTAYETELAEHRAKLAMSEETHVNRQIQDPSPDMQTELEFSQLCSGALEKAIVKLNNRINELQKQIDSHKENAALQTSAFENTQSVLKEEHKAALAHLDSELCASQTCNQAFTAIIDKLNGQIASLNEELAEQHLTAEAAPSEDEKITALQEEARLAKEAAEMYEHSTNTLTAQLRALKVEESEKSARLQEKIQLLEKQLIAANYAQQEAPGIKPSKSLGNRSSKPQTTAGSKVAYACSQISKLGATALSYCNRSPDELIQEAILLKNRNGTLERELQAASYQKTLQERRIKQLEELLSEREAEEEEDVALIADDEIYDDEDSFVQPSEMRLIQESSLQQKTEGTATKTVTEKQLKSESVRLKKLDRDVDNLDEYDSPVPGSVDLQDGSRESLEQLEKEVEEEGESHLAKVDDDNDDEDEEEEGKQPVAYLEDEDETNGSVDEEDEDEGFVALEDIDLPEDRKDPERIQFDYEEEMDEDDEASNRSSQELESPKARLHEEKQVQIDDDEDLFLVGEDEVDDEEDLDSEDVAENGKRDNRSYDEEDPFNEDEQPQEEDLDYFREDEEGSASQDAQTQNTLDTGPEEDDSYDPFALD